MDELSRGELKAEAVPIGPVLRSLDWETDSDDEFLKAAKFVFLKHGEILKRLGQ